MDKMQGAHATSEGFCPKLSEGGRWGRCGEICVRPMPAHSGAVSQNGKGEKKKGGVSVIRRRGAETREGRLGLHRHSATRISLVREQIPATPESPSGPNEAWSSSHHPPSTDQRSHISRAPSPESVPRPSAVIGSLSSTIFWGHGILRGWAIRD